MPNPIYIGRTQNPYGTMAMNLLTQIAMSKIAHKMRIEEMEAQARLASAEKGKEFNVQAAMKGSDIFRSDAEKPPEGYIQNPWDTTSYIKPAEQGLKKTGLPGVFIGPQGQIYDANKKSGKVPDKIATFEIATFGAEAPDKRGTPEYLKAFSDFWSKESKSATDIPQESIDNLISSVAEGRLSTKQIPKRGRVWSQVASGVTEVYPKFDFGMNDANYKYRNDANILRSASLVKAAMPRVMDLYRKAIDLKNSTNLPILDEPLNKVKRAVGNERVADFESLRNALLFEVNTALSGSSVASDYRIKLEIENLKSGMTFGQQIKTISNLISALQARSDASTLNAYPMEVVQGKKTLDQWRKEQEQEVESTKKLIFGKGDQIQTPKTQQEYDALPSGTIFIDPDDGKKYRKP